MGRGGHQLGGTREGNLKRAAVKSLGGSSVFLVDETVQATNTRLLLASEMVKTAAGLQQKRPSKQQMLRAAKDYTLSVKAKKEAAAKGLTVESARQANTERAAATLEKKQIRKGKRENRKEAKRTQKEALAYAAATEEARRAEGAAQQERAERQAAALKARAARLEQEAAAQAAAM